MDTKKERSVQVGEKDFISRDVSIASVKVGFDEDLNLLVTLIKDEDSVLAPTFNRPSPSYLPIVQLKRREAPNKIFNPSFRNLKLKRRNR